MRQAWIDETLTVKLPGISFNVAFPTPHPVMSLVAAMDDKVVGQCAAQTAAPSWEHVEGLGGRGPNGSTWGVVKIYTRVVAAETRFPAIVAKVSEKTMRCAGIAVVPRLRGQRIGKAMRARQIEVAMGNAMTGLFSETTNRDAADTITLFGAELVAKFPFKDLARELNESRLVEINDSFKVW